MFSKSKRFPEVGKDYIPGPGEYDVSVDDSSRHKRYGFLTQTNRFSEGHESSESTNFYISTNQQHEASYATSSFSSDTRASSTSSNRTEESNSPTSTSPSTNKLNKKSLSNSLTSAAEMNQQMEKYKTIMHKEIEALHAKCKKMEFHIQSLETDKNDNKAILLAKDLELADLRSKNAVLQKTINRQEISSKAAKLQKKIDQLEEQLSSLQSRSEKEAKDKNQIIEQLDIESKRSLTVIANLEQIGQEQDKKREALEAQINSLSAQLSDAKNSAITRKSEMKQLQQSLEHLGSTNTQLMQDLEASTNETESIKTLNDQLTTQLNARQEMIAQLESRVDLKDEEIDGLLTTMDERDHTLQEKTNFIDNLQRKFKTYRHYIDYTVIPYLRQQRTEVTERHYAELNQLLTELHEAKKFINRQGQYLDGLKSDVHWLTIQNEQLNDIITNMSKERTEQYNIIKKGLFGFNIKTGQTSSPPQQQRKTQVIDDDVSDTVSYSSRSTISNHDPLDSNLIILNDSGFGILIDETK